MLTARGLCLCVLMLLAPMPGRSAEADDLTRHVDPMIGTFGSGFVFPGPAAPFGMVQLSPDTEGYFAYTGYIYSDQFIRGFSHVHIESMGVHAGGDLPFMPTVGPIVSTDPAVFRSKFDHATERAEPGYYRALLSTYGIDAELTAGTRVGMHRYTFPPSQQANVIIDAGHAAAGTDVALPQGVVPGTHPASLQVVDSSTVIGSVQNTDDHYDVHFAAKFSRPFESSSGWNANGGAPDPANVAPSGSGAGLAVTFDTTESRTLLVKVGISFVSRANALANLEDELPAEDFDFDALRAKTRSAWNEALHAIEVTGGTDLEKRSFYTALYHAQHHPNVFEDANGEYMGNDRQVYTSDGFTYYTNFSLWDTYRTEMQLLALVQPDRYRDMMRSLLRIAQDGGRLPRWNLMNHYADFMNGEPSIPSIVDGYCRGLVAPEDVLPLYVEMRKLALDQHRDPSYLQYGYVPHDVSDSGTSTTQEHAIADFALALMAHRLGFEEDRDALLALAESWRNVFDAGDTKFIRPRLKDGSWVSPFEPMMPDGYREGTGWQYLWLVPHDLGGLAAGIGHDLTIERLDTFFSTALAEPVPYVVPEAQKHSSVFGIAYYGNQFSPANEHDLQAPYTYNYVGQPWKTQALMRGLQNLYRPLPDGLPGNDDLGTMSAWYIWAALGFYPQTAGAPVYTVGSPIFELAEVRLPGGTFTIAAPGTSPAGKYVQSASLNGDGLTAAWFAHSSIIPGGTLTLSMGPTANTGWGSGPADAPPSQSSHGVEAFGCAG